MNPLLRLGTPGLLVMIVASVTGCAPSEGARSRPSGGEQITVFAAASLIDAFTEVGASFEASHPGAKVAFSFAGSQNLRTQLEQGAQADVFASADAEQVEALVQARLIGPGTATSFIQNGLVIVVPLDNPAGIRSPQDIAMPGIKLVIAAEEVPAGRYTRTALANLAQAYGQPFLGAALDNVVSQEDNVRQVFAKVQLGEADAGIVYVSDAHAAEGIQRIMIPADANVRADYLIAPLTASHDLALANGFIELLLSAEGQAVLAKWGFTPLDR
jgi:molybdate transport system substrate-binding protein